MEAESLVQSGSIRLLVLDPRFERAPVHVSAAFDERSKKFYVGKTAYDSVRVGEGKDAYYESKDAPITMTNVEGFRIDNGTTYDTDSPADMMLLQIVKDNNLVAPSRKAYNLTMGHRFYIEDIEQEASLTSTKADRVYQALEHVKNMTAADKRNIAFFLKQPVRTMSEKQVDGYLKGVAMEQPELINNTADNDFYKGAAFVEKMVQYGLFEEKAGQYRYGTEVIGIDLKAAVSYLQKPGTRELVKQLKAKLAEKSSGLEATNQSEKAES